MADHLDAPGLTSPAMDTRVDITDHYAFQKPGNPNRTVLTGEKTDRQCPPDRARGDDDMLAALTQVTNWRRDGDTLILIGPRTLRFRLQTN